MAEQGNNVLNVDHEVRISLLEEIFKDIKETLKDVRSEIRETRNHLDEKIDSHFKWMLATMFLLIITVLTFIAMTKFS